MAYVTSSAGSPPTTPPAASGGCIFCDALASSDDRKNLILRRSPKAFLILNKYPYAAGHVMVSLNRHVGSLEETASEELGQAMELVQAAVRALGRAYAPEGFNVGLNQGRAAGAGVLNHLHIHVVPRWSGDVNFMPLLSDTKVLPESLDTTYDRLQAALGS
jgi:ATP adenylyltransferase